jgi:probable FeS assembly SUF system protein SufT
MIGSHYENITLSRDVEGLIIPSGSPIWMKAGTDVQLTQALGSSFTIFTEGQLVRLYGKDADAISKPQPASFKVPPGQVLTPEMMVTALRSVFDPEIPVNIVDLGLIYDCHLEQMEAGVKAWIVMTLTAPACGMGPILAQDVESIAKQFDDVIDVHIDVVFDPPWSHDMMTQAAKLELGLL